MLKKLTFQKIALTTLFLLLAFLLYNYPEEINQDVKKDNDGKTIKIYLIDENDFIGMTEINSSSESINERIEELLNALIINNSNVKLPDGFKALIPEKTKVLDYNLNDGLLKVNFSKEFLNVSKENEEKMMEAIIFSLTSIKDVKKIMIFVDGERLLELPNSKKKLDLYLTRSYGINKVYDLTTITNSQMVTVYYLTKNKDYYYVPVSYITNSNDDKIEIIINNLKSNRLNSSNLLSHLDYQVELMNYEASENSIALNFNEILLKSVYDGKLKEEVKYAIFYSVYDTLGIDDVIFEVDSKTIDEFRLEN